MENALILGLDLFAKNGKTAFNLACIAGQSEVVNIFMENAAALSIDINTKDNKGFDSLSSCM